MKRFAFVFGLIVVLGLTIPYIMAIWGLENFDAKAKANATGKLVALEHGDIHYEISGPKDGPVVVMVHGLSTPSFAFNQNASGLAEAGFRVLKFDHYGRGWSDRPKADYTVDFYDAELTQLLDRLNIKGKINLVGYSMGAVVAVEFAARHKERVNKVVLLAPPGLSSKIGAGFAAKLIKLPIIGDWLWTVVGRSTLLEDPQYQNKEPQKDRQLQGDMATQMNYKGYFPALLSTIRHLPMSDRTKAFVRLAQTKIPVSAVFGTPDQSIPLESEEKLRELIPHVKTTILKGADHGLPYKKNHLVNPLIIQFLQSQN